MRIERDQLRTLGIIALILAAFGLGSYLPARSARATLAEREQAARRELGIDPAKTSLKQLHERVAELRLASVQKQGYVPSTDELAEVLRGLTEALSSWDATVHEVVVEDIRHHRDYSVIPLRLRFDAPSTAAYAVLKQMESMARLIRMERLAVSGDPTNPAAPVRVEVQLSTFFTPAAGAKEAGGT